MQLLKTSLNMIITGNPGTGKTTIARMIAKYLHAFGILPRDRFVEKNGLDLKGKFLGAYFARAGNLLQKLIPTRRHAAMASWTREKKPAVPENRKLGGLLQLVSRDLTVQRKV